MNQKTAKVLRRFCRRVYGERWESIYRQMKKKWYSMSREARAATRVMMLEMEKPDNVVKTMNKFMEKCQEKEESDEAAGK